MQSPSALALSDSDLAAPSSCLCWRRCPRSSSSPAPTPSSRLAGRLRSATRRTTTAYDGADGLCADPNVEAVWVSTPNQMHAEHALLAASNGKHLCVRKPLARTMEDCQRIVDVADRNGVKVLGGGQTQGTNPLVQTIRQMILDDTLGPLRAINMWAYTGWMLRPRLPQEVDENLGGGIVWRQAPHQIETVRWLGGGKVRSVRAITGRWRPERPKATGYFTALLEFEDGTPVTMVYNAYGYFDSVELVGWGTDKAMEEKVGLRQALLAGALDEEKEKEATRFGALVRGDEPRIPWEVAGRCKQPLVVAGKPGRVRRQPGSRGRAHVTRRHLRLRRRGRPRATDLAWIGHRHDALPGVRAARALQCRPPWQANAPRRALGHGHRRGPMGHSGVRAPAPGDHAPAPGPRARRLLISDSTCQSVLFPQPRRQFRSATLS